MKEDGGVVKHEMMKCGNDGGARMERRTRKEDEWKQRTRRDRSLVSRVVHFAHGAAQRCAENCRGGTDSVQYRVWCNDKSHNLVFRNCGSSAKCRKSKGWSMSLSWCIGSLPPLKTRKKTSLSPSESFVKNQIACLVRIVLCERRLGRKNPINVVSSPLPSFLLRFFFCNIFSHNISFTKKKFPCKQREVYTEHLTALTFLSVPCQPLSVC